MAQPSGATDGRNRQALNRRTGQQLRFFFPHRIAVSALFYFTVSSIFPSPHYSSTRRQNRLIMWLFFHIMGCSALHFILLLTFFYPSFPHYTTAKEDARRITWTNKTKSRQQTGQAAQERQDDDAQRTGGTTTPNGRAERQRSTGGWMTTTRD